MRLCSHNFRASSVQWIMDRVASKDIEVISSNRILMRKHFNF
jgi:hypothetical protein